jgi:UDP:flavonoid glycosyltransferase YjiC (YdhE family)
MARFVFIVADSWGPLGCTIPVARQLVEQGDEVAFLVFDFHGFINRSNPIIPSLDAKALLRGEGFTVLEPNVPLFLSRGKVPTPKNFLLEYRAFQSLFRDYLIPYYEHWAKAALTTLRDFEPNAVWIKDQVLAGCMAAELLGVPWATFSVHTGLIEDEDSLPWTLGLSKPKTIFGRFYHRLLRWAMRRFRMTLDGPFNESRRRLGLPPITDALRATAISRELYLLFVVPELEPPRQQWPEQVRFVGPYSWDEPKGYRRPEWLAKLPAEQPLVYATIGTLSNRMEMDFYTTLMQALGDQPFTVAVSVGAYGDDYVTSKLPAAPANFQVEAFLPNSLLIPRARVLVHHGGAGTTMHGFVHGVPAVAVPLNHEHHDFAQRIVERGCGIRIDKSRLTAAKLREAVLRVLQEPGFQSAANRVRREIAHYDAVRSCVSALQSLASSAPKALPQPRSRSA